MLTAPEKFATARMTAERVGPDNFEEMHVIFGDQQVMGAITGQALSAAETHARVELYTGMWREKGHGLWIARNADGEVLGHVMLLRRPILEGIDAIEVGYAFRPQFWGQGYATEGTQALLQIAFDTLNEPEAIAITAPQNFASRRVMEKNGMSFRRDFIFREKFETVLYGITKDEWQQKSTSRPA